MLEMRTWSRRPASRHINNASCYATSLISQVIENLHIPVAQHHRCFSTISFLIVCGFCISSPYIRTTYLKRNIMMSTGMMATDAAPSVVCIQAILSTATYCPILSAHETQHASDSACPDDEGSNMHYIMNMMNSDSMCCTNSATITQVGSSMACCPCGALCTGAPPLTQNWYTNNAGQVVLTTGTIPSSISATVAGATTTAVSGPSVASIGLGELLHASLALGVVVLTGLMAVFAA